MIIYHCPTATTAKKYAEEQLAEKVRRAELEASVDDWSRSPSAPVSERAAHAFRKLGIWRDDD